MEPLYPQNILERRYPILREQREKAERDAMLEKLRLSEGVLRLVEQFEGEILHKNEPVEEGEIGQYLNTVA